MDKVTMLEAFTQFDRLIAQFAKEGVVLDNKSQSKKEKLDRALELHARVAAQLKVDPKACVPEFKAA